ncbi:putative polyketide synthase 3 [Rhizoctonia solani]|uniref:Putative polyketide synthase 3 n=1 Tax=Rhizoctonia solani TaxID=456999 RepID=A0A0K6FN77_9AGAM|nr:putative polyketide synthase 3 [Rhizoctonia solani]
MAEGKKSLNAKALCKLRRLGKFATSRKAIPVFKGTLAYILAFVLIFLRGFDDLSQVPVTLTGTVLIVIAGTPGKSVGACLTATFFALLGVSIGALNFLILAKLGHEPVAQAVVFAVMVYLLALIKAQGLKYFGFSLLAILMSFNGIYTSIMLGNGFNSTYLIEYIKSYLWGSAIVLFVNIFVFPISSERELRQLLVMSLEHVATYSHLLAKTYTLSITDEERDARARLAQTIRADFGLLTMKMAETSAEINWSRWSMDDYLVFVAKTRASLITSHTSISNIHTQNATLFKEYFLPSTLKPFQRMRRDIDMAIQEISEALGGPPTQTLRSTEFDNNLPPKDPEKAAVSATTGAPYPATARTEQDLRKRAPLGNSSFTRPVTGNDTPAAAVDEEEQDEIRERLRRVAARLTEEVASEGMSPISPDRTSPPTGSTAIPSPLPKTTTLSDHSDPEPKADHDRKFEPTGSCTCGPSALLNDFESFRVKQQELLGAALVCGRLHGGSNRLRLYEERKSVAQEEGRDWVRGEAEIRRRQGRISRATSVKVSEADREPSRPVSTVEFELEEGTQDEEEDPKKARENQMMTDARQCMVRVYSLLYALNQFTHELSSFHEIVVSRKSRSKWIHVHMFEMLAGKVHKAERKKKERAQRVPVSAHPTQSDTGDMEIDNASQVEDRELCVREALALLEQKEFVPQKTNFWQKLELAKHLLESPTSIYAGKTAAATLIFAVLIWAPTTRQWFINYGLTGGLITVVVALTPTLGQTLFTFVMQIVGSAVGYIVAIIVLEAFKDVGGYRFNPYGIVCLIGLYSIPFQYLIYENPMYFTLALLALNGTGVLVVTEWMMQQYQGRHNYDSPPYRAGKALSSLAVALAIVGTFQLVVLRNPARRQLRQSTARIVYGLLGYNTILQAYVRATMPADSAFRAPQAALERVEHDLRHREMKLQAQLIEVMPLLMFANSEPQLVKPFRGDVVNKILKSCRIILDRYREARAALGTTRFDEFIVEEFISVLSPYRRRFTRTIKTSFYLVASSLANKFPLPHDIQGVTDWQADFIHDALVLSTRMARTETGANSVRSDDFSRYWYYLLTVSTIGEQLKEMEMACKELFGELEDHPKVL